MDEQPSFALLLRRQRQAAGLTQEALAERAHLSARTVSDLERGLNLRPRKDSLALLMEALALPETERAQFEVAARRTVLLPPRVSAACQDEPVPARPGRQQEQAHSTNLPRSLTSFIGRAREQAEVARLLQLSPLLTLTGTGGCGKTRLALEVATSLLASYPAGVWLVELAPLADAALVATAVATALGVVEEPGRPLLSTLIAFLRDKHLLLVLDNCEHLVSACAEVAGTLLRGCPRLQVLATSREVLGVAGEQLWRVPSLSLPDRHQPPAWQQLGAADAVRLFVARAQAVRPGFVLTAQNAAPVAEVCARLDGIPLALELAAARLSVLTPEGLAARLDASFRLLTGGSRTALPRQQTLRATLEWSWNLLGSAEQVLLRRLAVFASGWTLEAAEMVCAGEGIETDEVLDLLGGLVNKSLVAWEGAGAAAGRFGLLETVRQYALEHLLASGEEAAVRRRHLTWCLALAERIAPPLIPGAQLRGSWLDELESELDNLRVALRWAHEAGEVTRGLRLAQVLGSFWDSRSHNGEGMRWLHVYLAQTPLADAADSKEWTSTRAWAYVVASWLACLRTEPGTTRALAEQGQALFRSLADTGGTAVTLNVLGCVARDEGDFARSIALLEEGLALVSGLDDTGEVRSSLWFTRLQEITLRYNLAITVLQQGDLRRAAALTRELEESAQNTLLALSSSGRFLQALVALEQGDLAGAMTLGEEALAVGRQIGQRRNMALVLSFVLSAVQREQGNLKQALALSEESLALGRELQDGGLIGWACLSLGQAAYAQGEVVRAQEALAEGLRLFWARGMRWFTARCLAGLAQVACLQGRPRRAALVAGATEALLTGMNAALPRGDRAGYRRAVDAARAALGDQDFTASWQAGQALPLEQVVAEALPAAAQPGP